LPCEKASCGTAASAAVPAMALRALRRWIMLSPEWAGRPLD
jgi:hypothetical protein